jgi:hypothetical protein
MTGPAWELADHARAQMNGHPLLEQGRVGGAEGLPLADHQVREGVRGTRPEVGLGGDHRHEPVDPAGGRAQVGPQKCRQIIACSPVMGSSNQRLFGRGDCGIAFLWELLT